MKRVAAVVFDLDGTITKPVLDFDQIRREIGGISGPILEAMEKMTAEQRRRADEILDHHERIAAETSELNPGAADLLTSLRRQGRLLGVVTRNKHQSVQRICRIHHLRFDSVVTREDGPAKPDPFGVLRACEMMGVRPNECLMVGDYVFDLISGRRAGARSVLLTTSDRHEEYIPEADYVIGALSELPGIIDSIENHSDRV